MSKKKLYSVLAIILVIAAAAMWFVFELKSETHATTIQLSEAQTIIDSSFEQMAVTEPLKLINSKSMKIKKSVWDMILKVVIAVASAIAGVVGANAMN